MFDLTAGQKSEMYEWCEALRQEALRQEALRRPNSAASPEESDNGD